MCSVCMSVRVWVQAGVHGCVFWQVVCVYGGVSGVSVWCWQVCMNVCVFAGGVLCMVLAGVHA